MNCQRLSIHDWQAQPGKTCYMLHRRLLFLGLEKLLSRRGHVSCNVPATTLILLIAAEGGCRTSLELCRSGTSIFCASCCFVICSHALTDTTFKQCKVVAALIGLGAENSQFTASQDIHYNISSTPVSLTKTSAATCWCYWLTGQQPTYRAGSSQSLHCAQ